MYRNRTEAGRELAAMLNQYSGRDTLLLALPRGGVVVGYEIAEALGAELDVMIVRKLGTPMNPEFGFGAIASHGARFVDENIVRSINLSPALIAKIEKAELRELHRREAVYRKGLPPLKVEGRTIILVDDGIATGGTARAAIRATRNLNPKKLIFAAPVSPPDSAETLRNEADEFVCPRIPTPFYAIGQWYEDFDQTSDAEVIELLQKRRKDFSGDTA